MQLNDSFDENYALEFDRLNLGAVESEALFDQDVFYNDDQQTRAKESSTSKGLGSEAYLAYSCLLYTSPSPRDGLLSRMPSSA